MSENRLIEVVIHNAREVFKAPEIVYDRSLVFQSIRGFDSVLAVQFILAIEAALDVILTEEEVDTMHTMGDLVATLRAKMPAVA